MLDMLIGRLGTIEDSQMKLQRTLGSIQEKLETLHSTLFNVNMHTELEMRLFFEIPFSLKVIPSDILELSPSTPLTLYIIRKESVSNLSLTAHDIAFWGRCSKNPYTYTGHFVEAIKTYIASKFVQGDVTKVFVLKDIDIDEGPVYDD